MSISEIPTPKKRGENGGKTCRNKKRGYNYINHCLTSFKKSYAHKTSAGMKPEIAINKINIVCTPQILVILMFLYWG
jgi:hypothetical protein